MQNFKELKYNNDNCIQFHRTFDDVILVRELKNSQTHTQASY